VNTQSISTFALSIFLLNTACVAQRYAQLRAFEDPSTHLRWVLLKDLDHPAAPRILSQAHGTTSIGPARAPAIRSGDLVIITQHTPVADGWMQGTALQDAGVAEVLRVRLKSNAHILTVIADGPGRATMQADNVEAKR
jgi:hypothetical protein